MTYVLLFIAIIAIFVIRHLYMKKIDEEEAIANKTPGTAQYIRSKFPNLVATLQQKGFFIEFERKDLIRLKKNSHDMLILQQMTGKLFFAYVRDDKVIQEWQFETTTSTPEIINTVSKYF